MFFAFSLVFFAVLSRASVINYAIYYDPGLGWVSESEAISVDQFDLPTNLYIRFDEYEDLEGARFSEETRNLVELNFEAEVCEFLREYYHLILVSEIDSDQKLYLFKDYMRRVDSFIEEAREACGNIEGLSGLLHFTLYPPVEICHNSGRDCDRCTIYWISDPLCRFSKIISALEDHMTAEEDDFSC